MLAADLNGDGVVSPIDVLIVVNAISLKSHEPRWDVNNDSRVDDEDIAAVISQLAIGPANASGGASTLSDGDPPVVSLDPQQSIMVHEGFSGQLIGAWLSNSYPTDIVVSWETQPGSATSPLDYQHKSGNTTIPAWETMVSIDYFGADFDLIWDDNEYYDVVITGVSAGTIGDGDVRVNIDDTSPEMITVMDGYRLESDTLIVEVPAGLLINDTYSQSHHQSIEVTIEPNHGTVSVSNDGSFTYNHTDDNHYGYDSFTYRLRDKNNNISNEVAVLIDVARVNMAIYDGQSGDKPGIYSDIVELVTQVDLEVTRGAFTVANKNDTNADGTLDNAQTEVLQTMAGVDEVDLMRLELYKPKGYVAGTSATLRVNSGNAYVWDKSTKDGVLPLAGPGESVAVTWAAEDPIEWWVESADTSTAVRDIQLTLTYDGSSDVVKGTGVWVEFAQAFHDTQSAQRLSEKHGYAARLYLKGT